MRGSTPLLALLACVVVAAAHAAPPHCSSDSAIDLRSLQRLDETRQDTGPVRTSLFHLSADLRQPLGFDQVYRLPGGAGPDRLARISGGLAAVFPRSTYVATRKGPFALVPPGTVFYIGAIPNNAAPLPAIAPNAADFRADTRTMSTSDPERVMAISGSVPPTQVSIPTADAHSAPVQGIMTDEGYRSVRVRTLLQTAAASSQPSR